MARYALCSRAVPLALITVTLPLVSFATLCAEPIVGLTTQNQLVIFDSAAPGSPSAAVPITGLQAGEIVLGIDRRPATGQLYALGSANRLYTVDTGTGAATPVGSAGAFVLSGSSFGFDFNPTVDRIRVTSNTDQNLRLNPNDGTLAATDSTLAYDNTTADGDPIDVNAGANPNISGSAYTNNFAGALATTLFDIDSALDILTTQVPPNNGVLNTVGPLGINASDLLGFDISGLTTLAYLSTGVSGAAPVTNFWTVNLGTGAATLVGTVGNQVFLSDIAAPVGTPVPEPSTLTLLVLGATAAVRMRRRG